MVNITKFAVKRPTTIILCLITIFFFGIQSLLGTKVELTPEMELPMLVISTVYAGASPDDINELITMKQEDAITSLDGVDTIQSYSQENVSVIMVQYEYGTNIDTAYINLKKAMDGIRSDLPDDANEPTIMELDLNAQPVVTLAVSGQVDGNLYTYVDNNVVPLFEKLGSVGEVSLSGGQKSYIRVELIPEKLEQYHLTMSAVGQIVGAADFTIPAGEVKVGKQNLDVSVGNDYDNAESLKSVAIPLANGDVIHLSDIAEVYDALEDADSIGRYNGSDIISLGIKKQQSSTAIDVSRDVMKEIQEIEAVNPGIRITVVNDSSEMITESISNVFQTMIMAVILSMIVLWLFYGDLRASVIVGTSIPISIMLALISMSAMGFSLNVISLTSLVLGVGMMVDNSINVLDGCFRAKEKHNFYDVAIEGSRTMIGSITGGTITTCVVFLPLAMLSGMSGQLFKQLGYTIVFCMIASLFSAVSIVPLCYYQWHPMEKENAPVNRLMKSLQAWYRKNMPSIIPRTRLIMGTSVLLLAAAFLLASRLNVDLMSSVDEGIVQVTVKTKPGLSIESVNETLAQVEDMIINDESVDHYLLTYGSSGLSTGGGGATLNAYLKDDRKLSTDEVIDQWRRETERYKDVSITMEQGSTTSSSAMSSSDQIEIDLQSTDYDALKMAADELADALREREDVMQVHSSIENAAPVIKVKIDPVKAQAEGLTPAGIGSVIYSSLSGMDVSTVRINGEDVDIRVEYAPDRYDTIDKLQGMMITTATGTTLPLEDLGDIYYEDSPQQIERKDKQYQVAITMEPQADYKKTAEKNVKKFVDSWELPAEVEPAANSMDEMMGEELGALGGALGTGVFLIFIVMAIQFESPKFSLMVMTTIPFSLIGSFGLLFAADSPISMVSMLGFLMLIGTVVNNGILYVETVNQLLAEMPLDQALVEAGAIRMRPIFMTTLTTVISMVPNALAYGKAGAMMQGLALVNVGGLIAATALTLIMLPTYYKLVYNLGRKSLGLDEENISD
ncbi:efflux RND transporter permease subunit [Enterocloster citroniae]|uniref:efflux RND transporter permease subunit n=1 Tax=Enterocloster citroniae TaxID=358743 RepID=UPI001897D847|nr:efflux RND transporter permease subunit [Enterocloster citroniae]